MFLIYFVYFLRLDNGKHFKLSDYDFTIFLLSLLNIVDYRNSDIFFMKNNRVKKYLCLNLSFP